MLLSGRRLSGDHMKVHLYKYGQPWRPSFKPQIPFPVLCKEFFGRELPINARWPKTNSISWSLAKFAKLSRNAKCPWILVNFSRIIWACTKPQLIGILPAADNALLWCRLRLTFSVEMGSRKCGNVVKEARCSFCFGKLPLATTNENLVHTEFQTELQRNIILIEV